MALKFRRGTTAQQSGSLAFGEPFVNTTLGTLLVGGATGDITLAVAGTGSTGTFGAISGSGLDITGNANIAGNLTLGGNITIGDAGTDTIAINADLSSSLIPNNDNAFTIGTAALRYSNIYGVNIIGSISANNGVVSGSSQILGGSGIYSSSAQIQGNIYSAGSSVTIQDIVIGAGTTFGKITTDGNKYISIMPTSGVESARFWTNGNVTIQNAGNYVDNGFRLEVSGSTRIVGDQTITGSLAIKDSETNFLIEGNGFSQTYLTSNGAIVLNPGYGGVEMVGSYRTFKATDITADGFVSGEIRANNGVVSGSSQVTLQSTTGFSAYDTALSVVTGSLITSASTAKTTNDSQGVSITNLNSYTSSLQAGIQMTGSTVSFLGNVVIYGTQSVINSQNVQISDNILYLSPTASIDNDLGIVGHYNDGTYRHAGIFMDASDSHTWKVFNGLTDETSAQVDVNGTGFTLADFKAGTFTGTAFNGIHNGTINATNGVVSGSSQLNSTTIGNLSGSFTGSFKGNLAGVADYGQTVAVSSVGTTTDTTLYPTFTTTAIIGSYSSLYSHPSGSFYYNGVTRKVYGETFVGAIEATNGVVSGSSQVDADTITNFDSNVLAYNNSLGVVSGSSQISLGSASGNIALATQTTGDYVASLVAGTGVTLSNNSGENATPTIAIGQSVATNATPTFGNLTINGTITATGDITAYYTSDKRHKNNIQTISNAVLKVKQLNGVTWEWNDDVNEVTKSTPKTGLIAQEVQQVLPQVVTERNDGFLALDYSKMVGLLVEAIKEQQIQIDQLKAQIGSK
jgi:hypothetical protein